MRGSAVQDTTGDELLAELAAAIDADYNGGFWWPGAEMAAAALRRWASFARRNRSRRPTAEERVLDLARGLRARFEVNPLHMPPAEWVHLAGVLAAILGRADAAGPGVAVLFASRKRSTV